MAVQCSAVQSIRFDLFDYLPRRLHSRRDGVCISVQHEGYGAKARDSRQQDPNPRYDFSMIISNKKKKKRFWDQDESKMMSVLD